ncbi:hypothetical protein IJ380_02495 [Candidatus Saccharibacteria bacterium]|nr:hypothetical protein [Candidatus Saccharibacteria bacterium]
MKLRFLALILGLVMILGLTSSAFAEGCFPNYANMYVRDPEGYYRPLSESYPPCGPGPATWSAPATTVSVSTTTVVTTTVVVDSGCNPPPCAPLPPCGVIVEHVCGGLTPEQQRACKDNRDWVRCIMKTMKQDLANYTSWRLTYSTRGKTANGIGTMKLKNTVTGEKLECYCFAYNGQYVTFAWNHCENKKIASYPDRDLITAAGQDPETAITDFLTWLLDDEIIHAKKLI